MDFLINCNTRMIVGIVFFSIVGEAGAWAMYNMAKWNNEAWNDEVKGELDSRSMDINTVQDCIDILNEIKEKHNNIDPIFKFARNEYRSRYDLVKGIMHGIAINEEQGE